jgi:threonyl-tRNA synthetase
MAKVTLPDGSILEVIDGATARQLAEKVGQGLAKAAVAARVDGRLVDLSTPLNGEVAVKIITRDDEGLK